MDLTTCPICSGSMIQKDYGTECQNCGEIFQYNDKHGFITIGDEEYRRLWDENKITVISQDSRAYPPVKHATT